MTTVGYADIIPTTGAGEVIAVCVMLIGIGTATLVIGAAAQRFFAAEIEHVELEEEEEVLAEPRAISARLQTLERSLRSRRSS